MTAVSLALLRIVGGEIGVAPAMAARTSKPESRHVSSRRFSSGNTFENLSLSARMPQIESREALSPWRAAGPRPEQRRDLIAELVRPAQLGERGALPAGVEVAELVEQVVTWS